MDLSKHPTDRRRLERTTQDRRDRRTRLEETSTEAERARRVAAMREEHHDRHAITVKPAKRARD
jgi:hypothetical protein